MGSCGGDGFCGFVFCGYGCVILNFLPVFKYTNREVRVEKTELAQTCVYVCD